MHKGFPETRGKTALRATYYYEHHFSFAKILPHNCCSLFFNQELA